MDIRHKMGFNNIKFEKQIQYTGYKHLMEKNFFYLPIMTNRCPHNKSSPNQTNYFDNLTNLLDVHVRIGQHFIPGSQENSQLLFPNSIWHHGLALEPTKQPQPLNSLQMQLFTKFNGTDQHFALHQISVLLYNLIILHDCRTYNLIRTQICEYPIRHSNSI